MGGYLRDLLARLAPLPRSARPVVEELGSVVVELREHRREIQALTGKPRRRFELRRLQRRRIALRSQLIALERRLEELAAAHKPRPPQSGHELAAALSGKNGGAS